MKVKTDSWHYKYIAKRWQEKPKALCWYTWKLLISMFLGAVIGVGTTFVAILILIALAYPIWQFWDWDFGVMTLSFILWSVIGVVGSILYRKWLYETGQLKRKIKKYKEPGITRQYMAAAHRKVCPLLDYEDKPIRW